MCIRDSNNIIPKLTIQRFKFKIGLFGTVAVGRRINESAPHHNAMIDVYKRQRGIRIDAIGMQGHIGMDYPKISEFEKSMLAFAGTGVKIMITELEICSFGFTMFPGIIR